ncbi:MAG: N-acetyl-gamma-glutamyl-phosphate reductase [Alphaproteobacteria bacterium]|nr:N-acetyl-gamma-glutamyl-phosphate reductase [Alphaproteobacteria bacterium]
MTFPIPTAILGASGYTGAELLRLLHAHPAFHIVALTGDSQAGKPIEAVYPHLRTRRLPALVKHTEVDFSSIQLVFCCLPHGTTQEIIAGLPGHVRIVDLSADFRLLDVAAYEQWYGHAHRAPALQKEAVYGLSEHYRAQIKTARLVANPGCYPTCSLLPLIPLIEEKAIAHDRIVINALSGISGAGRSAKQEMLFTELDGGVAAYGLGHHRHMAEIEQELQKAVSGAQQSPAGDRAEPIKISFTPHLVPMTRGMLATISMRLAKGVTVEDARATLAARYAGEPFVQVLATGSASTHQVRGTNQCFLSAHAGRLPDELILVSVIDNLVKGASGQALHNANLMFGLPETTHLELTAVFP